MAVNQTQGVVLAIFGASAGGHLSSLDANATANGLGSLAQDLSAAAGLILGVDLSSNATFTSTVLDNLGVTAGESRTVAEAYFTSQLAAGTSRGDVVAAAVEFLLGTPEAPFDTVANSFQSTVSDAVSWSQGAGAGTLAVAQLRAQQDNSGGDGSSLTFTTDADSLIGTAGNDTFTAGLGTLATGDSALDSSTQDADVMNITVSASDIDARIQNVETINIDGQYVVTGYDLANVTGANVVNLNTGIPTGTGTITNASSLNAARVVAGDNVGTLSVTATASGTRDTVVIDAGSASTVTAAGGAGADNFDVTLAADATATIDGDASIDSYIVRLGGGATLTGDVATENVELVYNGDTKATVAIGTNDLTIDWDTTNKYGTTVIGSGDVTITGDDDQFDVKKIDSSGSAGTVVVDVTSATDAKNYTNINVDILELSTAAAADVEVDVHSSVVVNLDGDVLGTNDVTLNLKADADTANAGAVNVTVSESQTETLVAGDEIGTIIIEATPDEASDTDDGAEITVGGINLATNNADTLVIQGDDNITISKITVDDDAVISGTTATGEITITDTASGTATIVLGSGNDTVSDTADSKAATIYGGAGDDTLKTGNGNNKVYGEDGDDTVTTKGGNDTIVGGAGDDTITASTGDNTITLGDGADIVNLAVDDAINDGTDDTTVKDFVMGTDKLILTGTATDTTIDLTSVTPSSGVYTIATGDFLVKLTGNTATDISDSVQLGLSQKTPLILNDDSVIVAGDLDDSIKVQDNDSATITTGAGSDLVIADITNADKVTVKDFEVGVDKMVLVGTATAAINLEANQTNASSGQYTSAASNHVFDLTDVTESTLVDIAQLGSKNQTFTAAVGVTTAGGNGSDYIAIGTAADDATVINGNGGKDYITSGAAAFSHTIDVNKGDSIRGAHDEISSFDADGTNSDTLDLESTNIGSVVGAQAIEGNSITGVTVTNGVITSIAGITGGSNSTTLAETVNASQLEELLDFLALNLGGTDTVAFEYSSDEDGDGNVTDTGEESTFVYQAGTTDTIVELIELTGVTSLATSAGANAVVIG